MYMYIYIYIIYLYIYIYKTSTWIGWNKLRTTASFCSRSYRSRILRRLPQVVPVPKRRFLQNQFGMGQVNILKIKKWIRHADFSIPCLFWVFISTFSSWNTFAAQEERGITLHVQLEDQVRYPVSSWDPKGPYHPYHPYHPCLKVVKKVLQQIARMAAQDQPSHCLAWPAACGARWPGTVDAFQDFLSVKWQVILLLLHRESSIASVSSASKYPSHHDFMMHSPIQA